MQFERQARLAQEIYPGMVLNIVIDSLLTYQN